MNDPRLVQLFSLWSSRCWKTITSPKKAILILNQSNCLVGGTCSPMQCYQVLLAVAHPMGTVNIQQGMVCSNCFIVDYSEYMGG